MKSLAMVFALCVSTMCCGQDSKDSRNRSESETMKNLGSREYEIWKRIKDPRFVKSHEEDYRTLDSLLHVSGIKPVPLEEGTRRYRERGTIKIHTVQLFADDVKWKMITVAESYLRDYPTGRYRLHFLSVLMWLYPVPEKRKSQMAEELANCGIEELEIQSRMVLAYDAHRRHAFDRARFLYEELIKKCVGSGDKAKYALFIADTYYVEERYGDALKALDRAVGLEDSSGSTRPVFYMAETWRTEYVKAKEASKSSRQLLFIGE